MASLNIRPMRKNLSDMLNRTYYQGERIVVTKHGRAVAALVPMADLEPLETLPAAQLPNALAIVRSLSGPPPAIRAGILAMIEVIAPRD